MKMAKGTAVVQQAIFTSAKTDRSAGYQILAASPGLAESDRRELAAWGPSHDSLLDTGPDALSVNFFPLPSGSFCVSRTTPAGWEYSGRGGYRIYTHCLIASPEVLWQFANHPLALLARLWQGAAWNRWMLYPRGWNRWNCGKQRPPATRADSPGWRPKSAPRRWPRSSRPP